jgi:FkbM family methyltransferase
VTVHFELQTIWQELISSKDPSVVWEIGTRDGHDSIELKKLFASSTVVAFEPTPKSFEEASKNLSKYGITCKNLALSDRNGTAVFYLNDPSLSETPWPDGNQGANSLYKANPDYPYESYVQIPHTVEVRTGTELILNCGLPQPEFLWIDTQGSEKSVLEGFGDKIFFVKLISTELSIKPLYLDSPRAWKVLFFLNLKGFLYTKSLSHGEWQFDAAFVNSRFLSRQNRVKTILKNFEFASWLLSPVKHKPLINCSYAQFIDIYWTSRLRNLRRPWVKR